MGWVCCSWVFVYLEIILWGYEYYYGDDNNVRVWRIIEGNIEFMYKVNLGVVIDLCIVLEFYSDEKGCYSGFWILGLCVFGLVMLEV